MTKGDAVTKFGVRTRGGVLTTTAIVAVLGLVAAGCGSSSTASGTTGTTSAAAASCPFSGTTAPSAGKATTEVATSLTKVTARKQGCIDNVQFDFSPGVPAWSAGYQDGPFATKSGQLATPAGKVFLVVEFQGVAGTYAGPSIVGGDSLSYVQGVEEVTGPMGVDEWVIGLKRMMPYTTTTSATPAYFVLGIG